MQPDHALMEARMQAALWRPETPEGLGAAVALDRRFAVYRNNVQHGLTRALAARFPVVERLVGPEFFTAVARLFAAAHPPSSPVLSDWGEGFPSFLRAFPPAAGLPYLPEVAQLEWLRGIAFHAADAPMVDPAALGAVDPARLILRFAPSVQAFASEHPAVSIWRMNQLGAPRSAPPKGPEYALIARDPGFALVTEPLAKDQHAILTALLQGQPFAEAAQTDPTPLLALLLRHRLIAQIEEQP
ncbi:putative DNA-binding domain-containing protein [Cereibacter sphaeroides]|nr:putative DNA-binding domain-containing protein [Cereibacter sphaeroides]